MKTIEVEATVRLKVEMPGDSMDSEAEVERFLHSEDFRGAAAAWGMMFIEAYPIFADGLSAEDEEDNDGT